MNFRGSWRLNFQDNISPGQKVRIQRGALLLVSGIEKAGRQPGPVFHQNFQPSFAKAGDELGNQSDPPLSCRRFFGHADNHSCVFPV